MSQRPFRILGLQQIAIGGLDKQRLKTLWVDLLGIPVTGTFQSERENVDEDILTLGEGSAAVLTAAGLPSAAHAPSSAALTQYEQEVEAAASDGASGAAALASAPATATATAAAPPHLAWPARVLAWASFHLRRADRRESALAYALFFVAYLSDLSLLALVLPASAFCYALVAVRPARAYWQAVLVYCEALIVASYALQVPARLGCSFVSLDIEQT